MAEYIDHGSLIIKLAEIRYALSMSHAVSEDYDNGFTDAVEVVIKQPKAKDVVPVVRCKDCKYMHTITEPSGKQHFHCQIAYGMPDVRLSDFCNHGERKTSDEE